MIIREMTLEDLESVYNLELDSYKSPWTKQMFIDELTTNQYAHLFVAEVNGVIIGYTGVWIVADTSTITKVTVARPLRKRGIGNILVNDLINRCINSGCVYISLEVRVSNEGAIPFYESIGFIKVTIKPHYYDDGEDAYYMVKGGTDIWDKK